MLATYDACDECECNKNLAGCDAFYEFLDNSCACNPGTPCATQCAAYCGGGDFDAACEACFNGLADDAACFEEAFTACQADAACSAYTNASDASCAALP